MITSAANVNELVIMETRLNVHNADNAIDSTIEVTITFVLGGNEEDLVVRVSRLG